jgi:cytoskeletal protein CcmA (bactofilin family)
MSQWKQQSSSSPAGSLPDQEHTRVPVFETAGMTTGPVPRSRATPLMAQHTVLTNGITVRGEIHGEEALYIDGIVEGEINVLGERVTVGPNGRVGSTSHAPCITAQEILVMGTVRGDIVAMDRAEIRANGSVTGDVSTVRLKIEDGSFFQGGIAIRKAEPQFVEEEQVEMAASDLEFAAASL